MRLDTQWIVFDSETNSPVQSLSIKKKYPQSRTIRTGNDPLAKGSRSETAISRSDSRGGTGLAGGITTSSYSCGQIEYLKRPCNSSNTNLVFSPGGIYGQHVFRTKMRQGIALNHRRGGVDMWQYLRSFFLLEGQVNRGNPDYSG